ncbi:MAG: hypothetical protein KIPDCIKN_03052 [Haliscomenobacter sp.]|nr:hypothetical protein [Haliscomenobacter sp.]
MNVVVDTNILFSALLKESNRFADALLLAEQVTFFAPKFVIVELFKYKEKISELSKMPDSVVFEALYKLLKPIHFFDESLLSPSNLSRAYALCAGIDEKDTPFVALTLELDGQLWTGDKKLKQGLLQRGFDRFFEG